ncbi:MAG TPA: UpxY family transcription antiterminator [Bryobacteraceae bacterium]|nr:UpxY family transcription antiterminator [Bryobacteraceae bacterium]
MESEAQWFALAVVPRKEKITAQTLRAKGYEDFLPSYTVRRRWSDRMKNVEFPLFPGYVFCRFDAKVRLPILKIPTVMSVVGLGKTPEPIPDHEIGALQAVCKAGVHAIPCPFLTAGAKVRINEGPLAGVEGILIEANDTRLVLSITLLQRSVSVEVDRDWIAPVRIYREF